MSRMTDIVVDSYRQAHRPVPAAHDGHSCRVEDIDELLRQILRLQPHEELDIVLTSAGRPAASKPAGGNGHRGYLMDIELGQVPTICVKRTF
ncbi:MAG: hypothetical protein FJ020_03495 [Chloroflexi bacterium]|nr:hypothetical protein [Chloroflexota bacterium]